ncbi:MAG: mechanosensitive ion channel [Burkholderiales bacterium]
MDERLDKLIDWHAELTDLAIRFGPKVLVAILIMVLGGFVGRWVAKMMLRGLSRFNLEPPVRLLLVRAVRVLVFGMFLIMALQNLGVELLPLIAGLGVAGAGVALAMQGVLSNMVAGLTIIFTRPFRVGEYISIVGVEGEVESISLFSTVLTHRDLSQVVVPNRKIVGEILHNYGRVRQVEVVVGVAFDTDVDTAKAVLREMLAANPRVLQDPAPELQVAVLADSSVNIAVRPWVNVPDYGRVLGELNEAILARFRDRGIVIPFPQREVKMVA